MFGVESKNPIISEIKRPLAWIQMFTRQLDNVIDMVTSFSVYGSQAGLPVDC